MRDWTTDAVDRSARASLVLADGSVFEGELIGADAGGRHRRGRVQHRADRLPGGHHRPELRRADHHVHQPAHRQLRRQRRRLRVAPAVLPRRRRARAGPPPRATAAPRPTSTRCSRRYGVPGHRRHRHPPPDPADPRHRRHARRVRHRPTTSTPRPRPPPPSPAPTASTSSPPVTTPQPYTVGDGGGPAHRRLRLRHQAHDPAPPRRASARSRSCRRRRRPPTSLAREPDGVFLSNGPGDPAMVAVRRRGDRASLLGNGARSSASASATSCSAGRSAATTVKLPFGHHGGNHPVQRPRHRARSRSPARTTTSPSPPTRWPAAPTLTHVNLNDGVCEGLQVPGDASAFSVQHHPEAGPGPHDSRYLFARVRRADDAHRGGMSPAPIHPPRRARRAAGARSGGGLMPKRDDIHSILIIGSGPIVIGQACEFDYSGTQACRVLREEGYRVILANSNPATIMTDPDFADAHLHRAAHAGGAGGDHRARAARRRAADARRPDRPEHRHGAVRAGPDRRARHARDDRRQRRGHRHRRGPRAVQGGDDRDRPRRARARASPTRMDEARGDRRRDRPAGHHPPGLHPRRPRHRHRLDRRGVRAPRRRRASPPARSARSSSRSRSPAGRSSSSR